MGIVYGEDDRVSEWLCVSGGGGGGLWCGTSGIVGRGKEGIIS